MKEKKRKKNLPLAQTTCIVVWATSSAACIWRVILLETKKRLTIHVVLAVSSTVRRSWMTCRICKNIRHTLGPIMVVVKNTLWWSKKRAVVVKDAW